MALARTRETCLQSLFIPSLYLNTLLARWWIRAREQVVRSSGFRTAKLGLPGFVLSLSPYVSLAPSSPPPPLFPLFLFSPSDGPAAAALPD